MGERCQCPTVAFDHSAGMCPHEGHIRVRRGGDELLLCANCTLTGDVYLDQSTLCEDCGEEGGNHNSDCPCWESW